MEFVRGDEHAKITRVDAGWLISYYRLGAPEAGYTVMRSKRRAMRAIRRGGWTRA